MLILGIDEAGRGPVVGPLVICGTLIDDKEMYKLERLKVKDSKLLTPKRREFLFDKIKETVQAHKIIAIEPDEIDEAVDGHDGLNLNWLEARKSAEIINSLKPDMVYLDCPSNNIKAFTSYVRELLNNKETKIISEHKADTKYVIVGAASILAKVTRDRQVEAIERLIGKKIGSGYPSDPRTQKFIKENHISNKDIMRKSWMSYKNLTKEKGQKKIGEF